MLSFDIYTSNQLTNPILVAGRYEGGISDVNLGHVVYLVMWLIAVQSRSLFNKGVSYMSYTTYLVRLSHLQIYVLLSFMYHLSSCIHTNLVVYLLGYTFVLFCVTLAI